MELNSLVEDNTNFDSFNQPRVDYAPLYRHKICLGPMVRANAIPFRILALKHGVDIVFSEELIDKRLVKCTRTLNAQLNTIDYVTDNCVLLRIDPIAEKGALILQLGTSNAEQALKAALLVQNDVAGVDINMGCPKKFSVHAGMGVALLDNPSTAYDIVKKLKSNLNIPVSVKMRLCAPTKTQVKNKSSNSKLNGGNTGVEKSSCKGGEEVDHEPSIEDIIDYTVHFMKGLISNGVDAITVHMRTRHMSSSEDLALPPYVLKSIIQQLHIFQDELHRSSSELDPKHCHTPGYVPILVNGDMYDPVAVQSYVSASMCDGVMLARPMLLNASIARQLKYMDLWSDLKMHNGASINDSSVPVCSNPGHNSEENPEPRSTTYPLIVTQETVIKEYLSICLKYEPLFQVVKYTLQEMMLARRHPVDIMMTLFDNNITQMDVFKKVNKLAHFDDISNCKNIQEMLKIFYTEEEIIELKDCCCGASYHLKENDGENGRKRKTDADRIDDNLFLVSKKQLIDIDADTGASVNEVPAHRYDEAYFKDIQ